MRLPIQMVVLVSLAFFIAVRGQTCGEYFASDSRVCHGRGICVQNNTCNCTDAGNERYTGVLCEQAYADFFPYDVPSSVTSTLPLSLYDTCQDSTGTVFPRCFQTSPNSTDVSEIIVFVPLGASHVTTKVFSKQDVQLIYVVFSDPIVLKSGLITAKGNTITISNLQELGITSMNFQAFLTPGGLASDVLWTDMHFYPNATTKFCAIGYSGSYCDTYQCDLKYPNNPSVCNSRGVCLGYNKCACNKGFVGSNCELPVCFGLNSSDPNVCSGHGTCVKNDTCLCISGINTIDNKCTLLVQNYVGIGIGVAIAIGILLLMCFSSIMLVYICSAMRRTSKVQTKWKPPPTPKIQRQEFFKLDNLADLPDDNELPIRVKQPEDKT